MGNCLIEHKPFARAVRTANLLGEEIQIHLAPETKTIEFSATSRYNDDAFSYSIPTSHINSIQGAASTLTISIDRIREITEAIPSTARVSLQLHPTYLTYYVKYPTTGAKLTMQIANRLDTIQ